MTAELCSQDAAIPPRGLCGHPGEFINQFRQLVSEAGRIGFEKGRLVFRLFRMYRELKAPRFLVGAIQGPTGDALKTRLLGE
jgi:hypothetical protein